MGTRQIDGRIYHRGDWVDIGKQTALKWIAEGSAIARGIEKIEIESDCGILARGADNAIRFRLGRSGVKANIETVGMAAAPRLPFPRTLLWQDETNLRLDLVPAGFYFLTRWEMAIPLVNHEVMAEGLGSEVDRERTRAVIHDLRVPVYRTDVIFAKDCLAARLVLELWQRERVGNAEERLALLRALYRVKPLLLALPMTWVE